jgi:hypothetical protein
LPNPHGVRLRDVEIFYNCYVTFFSSARPCTQRLLSAARGTAPKDFCIQSREPIIPRWPHSPNRCFTRPSLPHSPSA